MKVKFLFMLIGGLLMLTNCENSQKKDFKYLTEKFADIKILRYQVPNWDKLTLQQKKYVYYLTEVGYVGRDIIYDQNYKHNLKIKRALENIVKNYKGDKSSKDWGNFIVYTKQVWFANGIHHHYSNDKFQPNFSKKYFQQLIAETNTKLSNEVINVIFDPTIDAKKVNLDPKKGLLKGSATNFYASDVTENEVETYYNKIKNVNDDTPVALGLNTKIIKNENGQLEEKVWKLGGMYSKAIEKIIYNLQKAKENTENKQQADALQLLIEYYQTGDLKKWDEYNVAWTETIDGDIDYINGFVEVYNDPKGYKGSYENIVQIKDLESSKRMKTILDHIQWFESNLPIMEEHKKEKVVGIEYNVVNVAGESGDASPSSPSGVNLPNSDWIRMKHGSKSVSLGNIISAYNQASGDEILKEFIETEEERELIRKYGTESRKMLTALHEVVGHASGKLNEGVRSANETLRSYASTLEEARADLIALFYLIEPKMVELGLMESLDMGIAAYNNYIRNGLMTQLIRIKQGDDIEEAHMRNRQLVAKWVFEKGAKDNVISQYKKGGKTYFKVNDYEKLRELFGLLMREIQRIKSEGDYTAAKNLVETYGVKIDQEIHKEVLDRAKPLNIAPYGGFINPVLEPVIKGEEIVDIKISYPEDFMTQMLNYAEQYTTLPDYN